jgi:thiamine-monophosphate kinase
MRVSELGEFPLIERVAQIVSVDRSDIIVGIGDDVAVLAGDGDNYLLATVDVQVEGVHFLPDLISPHQLGRRALAINLSDIAAMGGSARYALVSLAIPSATEVAWVEALYRGLREEADRYGTAIVGGNMAGAAERRFVDVCVLGRVRREHLLLRSGAQPGDQVLVTGELGGSAAGLRVAQRPDLAVDDQDSEALLARYLTPTPRLAEAAVIARAGVATAMLDVSDGLSSDIGHICDSSRVGVRLWASRIPISGATRRVADLLEEPAWQLALQASDDYELCFTVRPGAAERVARQVRQETGTPVAVVGEILFASEGRWLELGDGHEIPLEAKGWTHF